MKFSEIFTFLKENKIFLTVKTKMLKIFDKHKFELQDKTNTYIQEKSPAVKEKLINFIVKNIDLPIYIKPFKGLVKKTLDKNFDKLINFILEQVNK